MKRDIMKLREKINEIDKEMAKLFIERMEIAREIGEYKKENNLPVEDKGREMEVIERNMRNVPPHLERYYHHFLVELMEISKELQRDGK